MNETCVILESLICMLLPQCHHISHSTSSIAVSRNPQSGQLQSYLTHPEPSPRMSVEPVVAWATHLTIWKSSSSGTVVVNTYSLPGGQGTI